MKDEKIKRRELLKKFNGEQDNQDSQDELFGKLETFEIDKSKKNQYFDIKFNLVKYQAY